MAGKNRYREIGQQCQDLYVKEDYTLESISQEVSVAVSTLSRWKKEYGWDKLRNIYRASFKNTNEILNKAIIDTITELGNSKNFKERSAIADTLAKLTSSKGKIFGKVDEESAEVQVMGEFSRYVTRECRDRNILDKLLVLIEKFWGRDKNE